VFVRYHRRISPVLFFIVIVGLAPVYAHTPLLFLEDNGDGTLFIQTGLSTGESSGGSKIIVREKETGQPLSDFSMPNSGKINIPLPKAPYTVTLDMGAGHTVTKTGPFTGATIGKDSALKPAVSPSAVHTKGSVRPLRFIIGIAVLLTVFIRLFTARKRGPKSPSVTKDRAP
jgi:hypothetical protein